MRLAIRTAAQLRAINDSADRHNPRRERRRVAKMVADASARTPSALAGKPISFVALPYRLDPSWTGFRVSQADVYRFGAGGKSVGSEVGVVYPLRAEIRYCSITGSMAPCLWTVGPQGRLP